MGIFGKFFGNSGRNETSDKIVTDHIGNAGTSMEVSSPYDIGKAFASLVTCAAVKNSEEQYMAMVDNDKDKSTTTFYCGGNILKKLIQNGLPTSVEQYIAIGVPRETAALLTKLPYKSADKIEVVVNENIDISRMKISMEEGISQARWRPGYCQLKDYIIENTNRHHIDLTVVND